MRCVRLAVAVLGVLLVAANALAQSCAMCGASFGENDPVSRAFSWSILFLMATPYTIVGIVGLFIFHSYRRAGRRRAAVIDLGEAARAFGRALPPGDSEGDLA
jgi:hypothetical protein